MEILKQQLDDILGNLSRLESDWKDELAVSVISKLKSIQQKGEYGIDDIRDLFGETSDEFNVGRICAQLFLGVSKDQLTSELNELLGPGGIGVKRFQNSQDEYINALTNLGLAESMINAVNYNPSWSDILIERLRSGRGSAIQGQSRGRGLEDFAEEIIKEVFGDQYQPRCTFKGSNGEAKCDFAIPDCSNPFILVESKAYAATGSKMTDIIGDVDAIINSKRHDTRFFLITDGITWKSRSNDLRKLIERQNKGEITRIYSKLLKEQFRNDLRELKREFSL